jgi:hypothetical protein
MRYLEEASNRNSISTEKNKIPAGKFEDIRKRLENKINEAIKEAKLLTENFSDVSVKIKNKEHEDYVEVVIYYDASKIELTEK